MTAKDFTGHSHQPRGKVAGQDLSSENAEEADLGERDVQPEPLTQKPASYSSLFCSVLVLLCSFLLCSVLFCSVLLCSVLICSIVLYLFYSVLFCSVLFCSVLFCSVLFCSVLFRCFVFPPLTAKGREKLAREHQIKHEIDAPARLTQQSGVNSANVQHQTSHKQSVMSVGAFAQPRKTKQKKDATSFLILLKKKTYFRISERVR